MLGAHAPDAREAAVDDAALDARIDEELGARASREDRRRATRGVVRAAEARGLRAGRRAEAARDVRRVRFVEAAMFAVVVRAALSGCKHRRWHAAEAVSYRPCDGRPFQGDASRWGPTTAIATRSPVPLRDVGLVSDAAHARHGRRVPRVRSERSLHRRPPRSPTATSTSTGAHAHPMNCVTWHQASAFCAWARGSPSDRGGVGVRGARHGRAALPVGKRPPRAAALLGRARRATSG